MFAKIRITHILYLSFFVSFFVATTLVSALYFSKKTVNKKLPTFKKELERYIPKEPEKEFYNVLLMGYGGTGHPGGGLTDANIVASFNLTEKKVTLIAVPRDLWALLPIRSDMKDNFKINAAYAIGNDDNGYPLKEPIYKGTSGGSNMAKEVFGRTLGLNIDYYISIDFSRFENLIDSIGGIDVNVPVSFTDEYFPIKGNENLLCDFTPEENADLNSKYSGFELEKNYKCRYETLTFNEGKQSMDGATTLKFIRSRHSETQGSDFARGQREQAVLIAIQQKLLTLDGIKNIDKFYDQFTKLVSTDITRESVLEFLSKAGDLSVYSVNKINLSTENYLVSSTSKDKQSILIPRTGVNNFTEIQEFLQKNI